MMSFGAMLANGKPAIQVASTALTEHPNEQPVDLDALLSPPPSGGGGNFQSVRDSMADSEMTDIPIDDVPIDDESRFSTVPLKSARQSATSDASRGSLPTRGASMRARAPSIGGVDLSTSDLKKPGHRRSASTSSVIHSPSGNLSSFLIHRLDIQKVQEEADPGARRASLEVRQRAQEELSRLQNHEQDLLEHAHGGQTDWDFWGDVMADYHQYASDNPEKLAKAIEKGIPDSLRGMVWQLMSASKDTSLEAVYLRLLKESSPHEKAILRDLGRTFPHHDFFTDGQGIGQENLFNVLKAYSIHDPEVGYCQGLPFVVAVLLLNMPDEEAFCLLVRLMHSYGLRGHFLPEMPGLQLRLYQFDRLVEELLPVLHVHFLRQGVKSSMFCSQWFLTMFSYRFPLEIVFRIYDNVLATGIEAIFGFSIALLQKNEEELLDLKFDEILAFLKTRLFTRYLVSPTNGTAVGNGEDTEPRSSNSDGNSIVDVGDKGDAHPGAAYRVDEFVQDAVQVRITPFMLDSYAHEYEDLVRAREAHAVEMDELRNTNRHLSAQVKNLEASLAGLNQEHCEIVKELVMTRLRNEEMEGELVRYKLLYADAMHQNEDALSSHRLSSKLLLH
ncbi:RabGAP/TBC [Rickenella mellea]|uniref:GTPase-activating protein GYP5 n=1 Tax=Rickenella mellea TaxID=50990 RepID=A0A4Y7QGE6_9AGAM|nr:RabGAP/TBC [Rickenella mellea]